MNKALRIWSGASVISGWFLGAPNLSYGQAVCQEARLTASDAGVFESFGFSAAVWGETALIGAHWDSEIGTEAGAAYIFELDRQRQAWVESQKLLASDGAAWNDFGHAIAMDGDLAAIAAHAHLHAGAPGGGSVYIFRHEGSSWIEEQELFASDGELQDGFAVSVAITGNVALIGALFDDDNGGNSGSAYVFRYDSKSDTWIEEQKLLASDGAGGNFFGRSVAIGPDTIVIGANGPIAGWAYVFRFDPDSSRWIEEQKLIALDGPGFEFGVSVSVSGDAILIGARLDGNGSAYVFRFDPAGEPGSQWIQEQKLTPFGGGGVQFGRSAALDGDTAVIGAWQGNASSGAAYVFRYDPEASAWIEQAELLPEPNAWTNFFGWSVAIHDETAVIGAHGEDQQRGAAYVFDVALNCNCPHDLDLDGTVGASDLLALLASWGPCEGCDADFDGDGNVGASDLLALLANWGPCP